MCRQAFESVNFTRLHFNLKFALKCLISLFQMTFDSSILALIRNLLFEGHSREHIFNSISHQLNIFDSFYSNQIHYFFHQLDITNSLSKKHKFGAISNEHHTLINLIHREFKKSQRSSEERECLSQRCKLKLLNGRYGIDAREKEGRFDGLMLVDNFYGQMR